MKADAYTVKMVKSGANVSVNDSECCATLDDWALHSAINWLNVVNTGDGKINQQRNALSHTWRLYACHGDSDRIPRTESRRLIYQPNKEPCAGDDTIIGRHVATKQ